MDFGRLPDIRHVDFRLPPDHPDTAAFLGRAGGGPRRVYLGAPVWSHPGFLGKIYPPRARPDAYLAHYADHFETIELNSTWYGVTPERVARWVAATPPEFRFCPKITREVSHEGQSFLGDEATRRFCQVIRGFDARLGPAWLLLPPSVGPELWPDLRRWLRSFPVDIELAIELRHAAWFADAARLRDVFHELEQQGVSAIISDVAGRRDVLHQRVTAPTVLLRFAGHRLDPTDFTRLDAWATRLTSWFEQGLSTAYVFFHQPDEHEVVELALHLGERLGKALEDVEIRMPRLWQQAEQGELF